jgi:hypothetical protein
MVSSSWSASCTAGANDARGVSMDITGIGAVSDLASTVIGKIWPDKTVQEREQLAATVALIQGQLEINKVEAANPSVFVSGWRPAIGWICGAACAWNWIGIPIAKIALVASGVTIALSPADLSEMMPVLMGMLGLSGMRTFEKINKVAAK